MQDSKPVRTKVFISYSHEDQLWLERLQIHLKPLEREGIIDRWDDTRITSGQKWKTEIQKALDQARVAVLLISADFLASDFITDDELPTLLSAAANEGLVVLPVILSPSRFARTPSLSQFQAVNGLDRPLLNLERGQQEDIWVKLTADIEDTLARPLPAPTRTNGYAPEADGRKVCFVVQGYGQKTDFYSGRMLDLDSSYQVVKEAIEEAGMRCVRADEIVHSGSIDVQIYEYLLSADIVLVDISTSNANAIYELGMCHVLRPRGTIVIAEKEFRNPFDTSLIPILAYEHLGKDLGLREAKRLKEELKRAIQAVLSASDVTTSPLYSVLPDLRPPCATDCRAAVPISGFFRKGRYACCGIASALRGVRRMALRTRSCLPCTPARMLCVLQKAMPSSKVNNQWLHRNVSMTLRHQVDLFSV
jgi:hypothetical protein